MLDIVASHVHLKIKYQNFHGDSTTISVNLIRAKRIYPSLQKKQKEGKATTIEINVNSLVEQLKGMRIRPPTKKMS